MARILLCPLGSHGDVHPFVAIGAALRARGHDVHLLTSEHFRPLAEKLDFAFAPIGTEADFQALIHNPDLWHPSRSLRAIYGNREWVTKMLRESYGHIAERHQPGETIVLGGVLAFGARLASEKLGVPMVTLHLQPGALYSVEEPPVYANLRMRKWWPRWSRELMYWVADRVVFDRMAGPPVNAFRRELGLPPVKRLLGRWVNSPDLVLNLFPTWFGSAPDWPAQSRNTGFVHYDQAENALPANVEAFLAAGEPPIVWTFGSAMRQGQAFFRTAAEACRLLGKRGLLLCKGREQVPADLPPGVMHADYAPFSVVFPRSAAVVHHGGIGTTAQALVASVPQLIMPLAFDQPDNAARLVRFGVARSLPPKKFTGPNAAAALKDLLNAASTRENCRLLAARLATDDTLSDTCDRIEGVREGRAVAPPEMSRFDARISRGS